MRFLFLVAATCLFVNAQAQNTDADSLQRQLKTVKEDTLRVYILESLSYSYLSSSPDTAMQYALAGLKLAEEIDFTNGIAICTNAIGAVYFSTGDYEKALQYFLSYMRQKERFKNQYMAVAYFNLANVYTEQNDYQHALQYVFKALAEDQRLLDTPSLTYDYYSLGNIYTRMHQADSAIAHLNTSYNLATKLADTNMLGAILNAFGTAELERKDTSKAREYYVASIPFSKAANDVEIEISNYLGLSKLFNEKESIDSAIWYARRAWSLAGETKFLKPYVEAGVALSDLFETQRKYDSAFYYQQLSMATRDSLFNVEQIRKVQNLKMDEELRQRSIETAKVQYENKIKLFTAIGAAIILIIFVFLLWRNTRQKDKANQQLQQAKEKVEATLKELQQAQTQLIHNEKMASLGELTAGIAHEIQNPLNFVNNFSEMNKELLLELTTEIEKGNSHEVKSLASDIVLNEEKINFHGKRAESIVRGMLQHSRNSSGVMEPTDINSLLQEYIRLAYHGLRAKDKSFDTVINTELDKTLGKINVAAQDIGRVFLNVLNNAFYAASAKKKASADFFQPTVAVSTVNLADKIMIKIRDNGTGIPQHLVDKIFQPFFTTKPTGVGTGLGLSISYDIITKGHHGEFQVNTEEGEFTEFIITIPKNLDQTV